MNPSYFWINAHPRVEGTRNLRRVGDQPMMNCTSATVIAARAASKARSGSCYRDRAGVLPGGVGCPSRGADYRPFPFARSRFRNRTEHRTPATPSGRAQPDHSGATRGGAHLAIEVTSTGAARAVAFEERPAGQQGQHHTKNETEDNEA